MKAVSSDVLALRKMRQPFQSKPAWKELLQSGWVQVESLQKNVAYVRKFLLTTNADNRFKLLSKFPDCTL